MSTIAPLQASMIADRYELRELVGRGGMSEVWRARDRRMRREVAVKRIFAPAGLDRSGEAALLELAFREARAAAQVTHPNAVRVYDVVADADRPCIVMEYVPASTLQAIIERRGPLAPGYVAGVGVALLDALNAAHGAGVLHRDVKPRNVLIGRDGRVMLADFGIALWVGAGPPDADPVGTPQFIAPERLYPGVSLPEGDLWSLGATLYTAVEGRPPYARASVVETLRALVTVPPDPPRQAGVLGPVLGAILTRQPSERPSAGAVRAALRHIAKTEPLAVSGASGGVPALVR